MIDNWEQIKTRKQRQVFIDRAVRELEKLVSSSEIKELLDDVHIGKRDCDDKHSQVVYLTSDGLKQGVVCYGHWNPGGTEWSGGASGASYCKFAEHKKIPGKEFRRVVEYYSLTPAEVSKVRKSLKA